MIRGAPKLAVVVSVALIICIAFFSRRQVSQPTNKNPPGLLNVARPRNANILHGRNAGKKLVGFWDLLNKSYVEDHVHLPQVGNHICEDVLCSEFLSQDDLNRVSRCARMFKNCQLVKDKGPTLAPTCHFINGTYRAWNVALVSFPGSGNTWTRGLLEKATGICTGSVPCDTHIWMSGSVGEGIASGSALVVKSHNSKQFWSEQNCSTPNLFKAAILIIRNPYDAIVSGYKWKMLASQRSSSAQPCYLNLHLMDMDSNNLFGENPQWQTYLTTNIKRWCFIVRSMVLGNKCGQPVLVVKYEDLKKDRTAEVIRMLDFLRVSYSPANVAQSLANDVTQFHRNHSSKVFEPYTVKQRDLVQRNVKDLIAQLQHGNGGNTLGLEDYL